jgi:hypothetical protein
MVSFLGSLLIEQYLDKSFRLYLLLQVALRRVEYAGYLKVFVVVPGKNFHGVRW